MAQQSNIIKIRLMLEKALTRSDEQNAPLENELDHLREQIQAEKSLCAELKRQLKKARIQQRQPGFDANLHKQLVSDHEHKIKELQVDLARARETAASYEESVKESQSKIDSLNALLAEHVLPNGEPRTRDGMRLQDRLYATEEELEEVKARRLQELKDFEVRNASMESRYMAELASAQERITHLEATLSDMGLDERMSVGNASDGKSEGELSLMKMIVKCRKELLESRQHANSLQDRLDAVVDGTGVEAAHAAIPMDHKKGGVLYWMTLYFQATERINALTEEMTTNARQFAKDTASLRAQLIQQQPQFSNGRSSPLLPMGTRSHPGSRSRSRIGTKKMGEHRGRDHFRDRGRDPVKDQARNAARDRDRRRGEAASTRPRSAH